MKKYIKSRNSLYETVDIAGGIFMAALAAMLAGATWLSLDWITRNNISAWAIVCLVAGTAVAGTIAAIFKDYSK